MLFQDLSVLTCRYTFLANLAIQQVALKTVRVEFNAEDSGGHEVRLKR